MAVLTVRLPQEQQIRNLLAKGEKEKGKQFLKEMISGMARKRRFQDAERLRELLIEIDPLALSDIISTAEIIENEKRAAINKNYLAAWSALSGVLDPHEFSTLYHSLEHKRFADGEIIVKQGLQLSTLYFVNSGRVELFFQENGRDVMVKAIGPGEIFGADTFFEASTWTINARSLGTEVSFLQFDKLRYWQKDFPGLEAKLSDYCKKFRIHHESFKKTGRDRRIFERVGITGRMEMDLLDREGKDTGIGAKGDLSDISAGGASFFLRISQKKNARLLLGRNVALIIASSIASRFSISGVVRAVRSQPVVGNEYSVSVQFSRVLTQRELKDLIVHARERERR